jgi:chitinase
MCALSSFEEVEGGSPLLEQGFSLVTSFQRAILNKQTCLFSKMEDRKVKQVLSGGWHQWERGGYKERVKEGEHGGILYTHK